MKQALLLLSAVLIAVPAFGLDYDQNVTPDVIFGDGNANGGYTVFTDATPNGDTIEVGLRAKLRFDETGQPQDIWNSGGNGSYYFDAGSAVGQSADTPVWNFEWAVNTDATGTGEFKLGYFTYELGLDFDPSPAGTNFLVFDPITPVSPNVPDHALGDNTTGNGDGIDTYDFATYVTLLSELNVAQQSWRFNWFASSPNYTFDPNVPGVYEVYLRVSYNGVEYAYTHISVSVGGAVSTEAASWGGVKSLYR